MEGNFNLLYEEVPFLGRVEMRSVESDQVFEWDSRHFDEPGVRKKNAMAVVGDDDALVEHLQDGFHPAEPFRLFDVDGVSLRCRHGHSGKSDRVSLRRSSERNFNRR